MQRLFRLIFIFTPLLLKANDGSFYVNGNHLIPMNETRISIKKEILNIKLIDDYFFIEVNYEFYNPDNLRILEIGFEAESPEGDVNREIPDNKRHPYIFNFTVSVNDTDTKYNTTIVNRDDYYKNGIYKKMDLKNINYEDDPDFYHRYVYHFKAKFKKGLNTLRHTYQIKASTSVIDKYSLMYVLTTAMRWANKQIDDFTLNIDLGKSQTTLIQNSFFNSVSEWTFKGNGTAYDTCHYFQSDEYLNKCEFNIQSGALYFHALNFKTKGELNLSIPHSIYYNNFSQNHNFDYSTNWLPLDMNLDSFSSADSISLKILKNWPYARRGYIFKSQTLQSYFEKMPWYVRDPEYKAELSNLSAEEKKWLKSLK
jgi:hypothetical protein